MSEITVDATLENIEKAAAFVEKELELFSCPFAVISKINIAVDELLSNIVNYAYPDSGGKARITVEQPAQNSVRVIFEDSGIPYNPLEKPDPDVTLDAEERQIGGLGIFIVKKTMDSVTYKREDGKNILAIEKKW